MIRRETKCRDIRHFFKMPHWGWVGGRTYHSAGFALLRVRLPEGFAKVGAFAAMYIGHHMARCLPSFPCLRKVAVKEVAQQCVVLVERHWLV